MTTSPAQSPSGPGASVASASETPEASASETPEASASGTPTAAASGTPEVPAAPSVVVHGDATPEQLAALVAVLSAASGGDEPASEDSTSVWAAHAAALRHPVNHGPGAWRTSLRP